VYLFRKLTGGGYDKGAYMSARTFGKALKDRQRKGRCFACSGLCEPHDILFLKYRRNCLPLYRCRLCKTSGLDSSRNIGM
jgi:hypothetical protein